MPQILIELATQIDVPPAHLAERRAAPTVAEGQANIEPLIRIRSGAERPADCFRERPGYYQVVPGGDS